MEGVVKGPLSGRLGLLTPYFVAQFGPGRAMLMPDGEMRYFDEDLLDLVALA